jgi:hypothetical protein
MITEHPSFKAPTYDVAIWRYMDLAKFLWFLKRRALYFSRSDLLGDPYEGHYTQAEIEQEHLVVERLRAETNGAMADDLIRGLLSFQRKNVNDFKRTFFVNCWHMNDLESAAMWKLYAPHHHSVCVKSTYSRLANALPPECMAGSVNYIDYRSSIIKGGNAFNYIVHKRRSFEHENELRAVIWNVEWESDGEVNRPKVPAEVGRNIEIDINSFVTDVLVSPDSDGLLLEVVSDACLSAGLNVPVLKSDVNAPPLY